MPDLPVAHAEVAASGSAEVTDRDTRLPRMGRRMAGERAPRSVEQVDLRLAQELVDRFVAAGAERVFVGPATGLRGPPRVVQGVPKHDDHLHVRLPASAGER